MPNRIFIYRMVHWENVEYILQHGICCREHTNADPDYISIGHRQLIEDRHEYPMRLPNAGNLGEYVPFYFAGHTPMLYLIMNGFKGVEQRPQEDIVFLVSTPKKIKAAGLEYVFTNMNAKIAVAEFYTDDRDLGKLDWGIIQSKHWLNNEVNLARQDYKQAEFLVRYHVPVGCITAIVVKNEIRKTQVEQLVANFGLEIGVHIDRNSKLYY